MGNGEARLGARGRHKATLTRQPTVDPLQKVRVIFQSRPNAVPLLPERLAAKQINDVAVPNGPDLSGDVPSTLEFEKLKYEEDGCRYRLRILGFKYRRAADHPDAVGIGEKDLRTNLKRIGPNREVNREDADQEGSNRDILEELLDHRVRIEGCRPGIGTTRPAGVAEATGAVASRNRMVPGRKVSKLCHPYRILAKEFALSAAPAKLLFAYHPVHFRYHSIIGTVEASPRHESLGSASRSNEGAVDRSQHR